MRKLTSLCALLLLSISAQAGVGRVRIDLIVSAAFAETVSARIDAAIEGAVTDCSPTEPSSRPVVKVRKNYDNSLETHVVADICIRDTALAKKWFDKIKADWTSGAVAARILPGSSITFHLCRHEDGEGECTRSVNLLERSTK